MSKKEFQQSVQDVGTLVVRVRLFRKDSIYFTLSKAKELFFLPLLQQSGYLAVQFVCILRTVRDIAFTVNQEYGRNLLDII